MDFKKLRADLEKQLTPYTAPEIFVPISNCIKLIDQYLKNPSQDLYDKIMSLFE